MEKKIEDYLHLYLGCRIWCKNGLPYTLSPYDLDRSTFKNGLEKPILRQLSDMTEIEFTDIENHLNEWLKSQGDENKLIWQIQAERIRYAISKYQFDCHLLIESGLAINKSTINQPLAGG